jgi:hypothetical protein
MGRLPQHHGHDRVREHVQPDRDGGGDRLLVSGGNRWCGADGCRLGGHPRGGEGDRGGLSLRDVEAPDNKKGHLGSRWSTSRLPKRPFVAPQREHERAGPIPISWTRRGTTPFVARSAPHQAINVSAMSRRIRAARAESWIPAGEQNGE